MQFGVPLSGEAVPRTVSSALKPFGAANQSSTPRLAGLQIRRVDRRRVVCRGALERRAQEAPSAHPLTKKDQACSPLVSRAVSHETRRKQMEPDAKYFTKVLRRTGRAANLNRNSQNRNTTDVRSLCDLPNAPGGPLPGPPSQGLRLQDPDNPKT